MKHEDRNLHQRRATYLKAIATLVLIQWIVECIPSQANFLLNRSFPSVIVKIFSNSDCSEKIS